jgi:4-amino-4-deoxychorismate lyase
MMIDVSDLEKMQVYRCRIIYGLKLQSVEYIPYMIKPLKKLQLVNVDRIDYQYKYLDRVALEGVKQQHAEVDDVIFVIGGKVTDCSYANLVFCDGSGWITSSTPLLSGTKRQHYLNEHLISERVIYASDLMYFNRMRIINSMIDLEESPEIPITSILM